MPHLDDLPAGSDVFIDSPILHYAVVTSDPPTQACLRFLRRIAAGEITACISLPVLNDAIHKVMCSEAVSRFNRPRAGIVRWLKDHPDSTAQLTAARELLQLVPALSIRILPLELPSLSDAQDVVLQHGLLASDAIIVAMVRAHGLRHIATNDDDFDRIPA